MASLVLSDLLKTLKSTFGIKLATLSAAGLTVARTFTLPDKAGGVQLATSVQTVTYAGSVTVNMALVDESRITLTGNLVLGFTGGIDGQKHVVNLIQDATGGRTLTFDSTVRVSTDLPAPTLSTGASKVDRLGFIYNATAGKYDFCALLRGL